MSPNVNKETMNGFTPLILIIAGVILVFASISVRSVFKSKQPDKIEDGGVKLTQTPYPTTEPTPSAKTDYSTLKPTVRPTLKPSNKTASPTPTESSKPKEFILRSPAPTPLPPDTVAPTTNIYYPVNNGAITYKIDGKVCAIASAPSDPDSSISAIETEFKFDDNEWSGYKSNLGYLCTEALANGEHTLSYQSRDKSGNTEAIKTLNFTVRITGN